MLKINPIVIIIIMWIIVWSGYNTGIGIVLSKGFGHGTLDLIHGVRAFFPIFAGLLAFVILFFNKRISKKFLVTPLGLFIIYGVIGIISSLLSKNVIEGLYWALMYLSPLLVLWLALTSKDSLKNVFYIVRANWLIAAAITFFLIIFFLIQPGVVSSLNLNSFICGARPYEGLGSVYAGITTLGMPGTRPTGLGRYAGIIAVAALCWFLFSAKKYKVFYFLLFAFFLFILLFSKGKTEAIAFIAAFVFVIFLSKKFKKTLIFGLFLIVLASLPIVALDIPCVDNNTPKANVITNSENLNSALTPLTENNAAPQIGVKTSALTLSSRLSVWVCAWNLFLKSPLFGLGFYADKSFLTAHNTILHALMQVGILGTIPFVLAFLMTFVILLKLFKNPNVLGKERDFLVVITAVLVFFVVRGLAESMAIYCADWLFVAPIIAYIQCLVEKYKNVGIKKTIVFSGVKFNALKMSEVLEKISFWIKNEPQKSHFVVATGMHGIVESEKHADFKYILNSADMFVPDGISLVWMAWLKGADIKKRISGPDLMAEVFKKNYNNFLYGDTKDTLEALSQKFPGVKIDSYSPPFRNLTQEEDEKIIEKINLAKPDILWVGLGLPKQERWIFEHKEKLNVPVIIGVGAAFKFLSGKVKRAPKWVGNAGFEWLWRLFLEPKKVWKRVFMDIPKFFQLVAKDLFF